MGVVVSTALFRVMRVAASVVARLCGSMSSLWRFRGERCVVCSVNVVCA